MLFLNKLSSVYLRLNKNTPKRLVKQNVYDRQRIVPILKELNKKDNDEILKRKREDLQSYFDFDVSEISEGLIEELSFLYKWYVLQKVTDQRDLISLRRSVLNIYDSNRNLPENIHNLLVYILIKNNAINENENDN